MARPITNGIAEQLSEFCKGADDLSKSYRLDRWSSQVSAFLKTALGPDEADTFLSLKRR